MSNAYERLRDFNRNICWWPVLEITSQNPHTTDKIKVSISWRTTTQSYGLYSDEEVFILQHTEGSLPSPILKCLPPGRPIVSPVWVIPLTGAELVLTTGLDGGKRRGQALVLKEWEETTGGERSSEVNRLSSVKVQLCSLHPHLSPWLVARATWEQRPDLPH